MLAVHDHVIHLAQRRRWLRDKLKALSAEAQSRQGIIEISQLLASIFDLLTQAVNKVFYQFLFGQRTLMRDLLLILRQLRFDQFIAFGSVAGGFVQVIITKIVTERISLLGFAQPVTRLLFGALLFVFVAGGILNDNIYRLAFDAALILLLNFGPGVFIDVFGLLEIPLCFAWSHRSGVPKQGFALLRAS